MVMKKYVLSVMVILMLAVLPRRDWAQEVAPLWYRVSAPTD